MAKTETKILRLRIQQDGIEREHLVTRGQRFTYGRAAGNDLVLYSAGAPHRENLVESHGGYYRILVPKGATGEIRAGDSVLRITDLVRHGFLRKKRGHYVLPVSAGKTGRLELDGLVVEYDFVPAPTELTRLPDYSWRRAVWKALVADPVFKLVFVALLTAGLIGVDEVKSLQFPERRTIDLETVPQRFVKFIPRAMRKEEPPPAAVTQGSGGAQQVQQDRQESSQRERRPERAQQGSAAQRVVQKGILGLIGGVGESASQSSVVDFLVDKGIVKELDQVLSETEDLQVGRSSSQGTEEGSLDDLFSLPDLSGVNVDEVADQATSDMGDVQLQKEGLVDLNRVSDVSGSDEALGQRTEQQLLAVIQANRGRLEYIYNKYLRQDPELSGVIKVEVTIEPDGTVSKVRVIEATVTNLSFINEILAAVRRWRFPAIAEGVVIATYPLVFYRTQ